MDAVNALRAVDFEWVRHIDSVWIDSPYDVLELHETLRRDILDEVECIGGKPDASSPLGRVVVGSAGTGKTHLVGSLRKELAARNQGFILVDMTDVHNFWETVLLGFLSSLQKPHSNGVPQFKSVLENLVSLSGLTQEPVELVGELSCSAPEELRGWTNRMLGSLMGIDAPQIHQHQDVIRSLILLNSEDFAIGSLGFGWLQGLGLDEPDRNFYGFRVAHEQPREIIGALFWVMSLRGPILVALDQLDAIVTQHHLATGGSLSDEPAPEQRLSHSIIEGIGGGLSALWEVSRRTLVLVSCLEATWEILKSTVAEPHTDRYLPPSPLGPVGQASTAERIVRLRLEKAYQETGFSPEYPTWPFKRAAFQEVKGLLPREILKRCDEHRRSFIRENIVHEVSSLTTVGRAPGGTQIEQELARLDYTFNALRKEPDLLGMLHEDEEDALGEVYVNALRCLIKEGRLPADVDPIVDEEVGGGSKSYRSLHARLRLVYRQESDREEHFCLRVLQRLHPRSYQARLKAAITASGIDTRLTFRRLIVVRSTDTPGGSKTREITQKFLDAGGVFLVPSADELRMLWAVGELEKQADPYFQEWLESRRPIAKSKLVDVLVPLLHDRTLDPEPPSQEEKTDRGKVDEDHGRERVDGTSASRSLHLGFRLVGDRETDPISIPLQVLTKHTIILAGSGSGKTVLVRRLVEEAALSGIPSIVIDCANDLARLGDRWPETPEQWKPGDDVKADRYHETTDVVIWTPGKMMGNPLALNPLPDLASLAHDPADQDELDAAIDMARGGLEDIVAPGNSTTAQKKKGVLSAALRNFANEGGNGLDEFIEFLSDLPAEAGAGIGDSHRLGRQIADSFRARRETDVLFRQTGSELDPGLLLGSGGTGGKKTRLSVINFIGLPSTESQQQFLNRLAMTLFTWIKKNPAPLNGLLVIDEAKDFVPSGKSTACKASILRLTAQARKYGLGLILATQAPKDIDHTIVGNCSTHFYGKASSPAAIDVVREQLKLRGGSGEDIPRLPTGHFYSYCAEYITSPLKTAVPLCLSYHPKNPLTDGEVVDRAIKSRPRAG